MMASAAEKRAAALKARMAHEQAKAPQIPLQPALDDRAARAHFMGASILDEITRGREVQALPVDTIAPELRPTLRQPRLLPLPHELQIDGTWVEAEMGLIEELLELGRSLQERQIQPIVVFPGSSEAYPAARYLIAAGHRRWTAAVLVGMATIDAIMIEVPTPEELVDIQYTENEDRTDFSDMERAWALTRMKQVLRDAPWEVVEQRFRLSEGRRKQLMRLMAFTPPQQQIVARIRASETQLRPLHAALREGSLSSEQADRILHQLVTRIMQQAQEPELDTDAVTTPARSAIDSRTVGQLMTRIRRAAAPARPEARPKWLDPLKASLAQARKGLQRFPSRAEELDDTLAMELQSELDQLLTTMTNALEALKQRDS
jgi:ParB/RepB/Spo0J family partition protein